MDFLATEQIKLERVKYRLHVKFVGAVRLFIRAVPIFTLV